LLLRKRSTQIPCPRWMIPACQQIQVKGPSSNRKQLAERLWVDTLPAGQVRWWTTVLPWTLGGWVCNSSVNICVVSQVSSWGWTVMYATHLEWLDSLYGVLYRTIAGTTSPNAVTAWSVTCTELNWLPIHFWSHRCPPAASFLLWQYPRYIALPRSRSAKNHARHMAVQEAYSPKKSHHTSCVKKHECMCGRQTDAITAQQIFDHQNSLWVLQFIEDSFFIRPGKVVLCN
jgi:hypothetical protein